MYPGPVLVLFGPLAPAFIAYLLRRWTLVAGLAGLLLAGVLAAMVAVIPLDASPLVRSTSLFAGEAWQIFGRNLLLTPGIKSLLLGLYVGAGCLSFLSAFLPQGRVFASVTLLLLSPLAAGLMAAPFSLGVLPLVIVAGLAAWLIQAGRPRAARAALRYLSVFVFAAACLLIVGWMADSDLVGFSGSAWRYYLAGTALVLAGFPFYAWVLPILDDSPPLTWAVLLGLAQMAVVIYVTNLLLGNDVLGRMPALLSALRASGAATIAVAGLLAAQPWLSRAWQRITPGRVLAYLLLIDMGTTLVVVASAIPDRLELIMAQHLWRFISLLLAGSGAGGLARLSATDDMTGFKRSPWATGLLIYGALSLAGLPLTPGGVGRWHILTALGQDSLGMAILLLLATISGVALLAAVCLEHWPRAEAAAWREQWQRSPAVTTLSVTLLVLALWLSLFPRPLLAYAEQTAQLLLSRP